MTIKPVPERYQYTVIPHIMIKDASAAIEFYKQAFSAIEIFRISKPTGEIAHAEVKIGNSLIMLGDATNHFKNSQSLDGTSVGLHVYVDDVDHLFAQAVNAGAIEMEPLQDMFHGDRTAMLKDPFGYIWVFLTHIKDMTLEEIKKRGEALFRQSNA